MGFKKIWRSLTKGEPGSPGIGGSVKDLPKEEPLECLAKEAKRDEHLKNLGMKRNKSIRKSIAKKLKRREKKEDLDGTNSVTESIKDKENQKNVINRSKPTQQMSGTSIQVETRTSIGAAIEGGKKVEVITMDPRKEPTNLVGETQPLPSHLQHESGKGVHDKLRRSIRHSMRKRKESASELSKAQKWQIDEAAVRSGTCQYYVKYLGCCEVFESRGMQVCEAAVTSLKEQRRRTVRGTLYISGDSIRVVDDDTKGLVLDQTIEKVSFCAPDRNFEKGFSYICRDGTTRRWMCHAFMAVGDSGERLSHAVGCAFGICLEFKQKRDKANVSVNYDAKESSFTRMGSFRPTTMAERLTDPQSFKPSLRALDSSSLGSAEGSQGSQDSPYCAVSRPKPPELMYQRQASFRGLGQIQGTTPAFKRGSRGSLSLRISDLPSSRERLGGQGSICDSPIIEDLELPPSNLETPIELQPNSTGGSFSLPCQELNRGFDLLTSDELSGSSTPAPSATCSITSTSPPPILPILQPTRVLHKLPETPESEANPWDHVPDQPRSPVPPVHYYRSHPSLTNTNSVGVMTSDKIFDFDFDLSVNKGVSAFVTVADQLNVPKMEQNSTKGTSSGYHSPTSTTSGHHSDPDTTNLLLQNSLIQNSILEDPFDAEWAEIATRNSSLVDTGSNRSRPTSTNPFLQGEYGGGLSGPGSSVQAFELQL